MSTSTRETAERIVKATMDDRNGFNAGTAWGDTACEAICRLYVAYKSEVGFFL